jgi:hypothetical protein
MEQKSENQNKPLNEETVSQNNSMNIIKKESMLSRFSFDSIIDAIIKKIVEINPDYDKEEDQYWMVVDYECEFNLLYEAAYKATQVEDETKRFYAYEDVIIRAIVNNELFNEPTVFWLLGMLHQPGKEDYLHADPPYWGVIPPDAPNRTKLLYYKAMIIDFMLELAQRMADLHIEWEK